MESAFSTNEPPWVNDDKITDWRKKLLALFVWSVDDTEHSSVSILMLMSDVYFTTRNVLIAQVLNNFN